MRRLSTIGLCLVAALAIGTVAAASASAEAPEYGRCIKKSKIEGAGFSSASCTKAVATKAKYEWAPGPGPNAKFTSEGKIVFSQKYKVCKSAIGEEQLAVQERAEAAEESTPEPRKAELLKKAKEHEDAAEDQYRHAEMDKAECTTLIEDEQAKAPAVLKTVTGTRVACGEVASVGEFSGVKGLAGVTMTFTECGRTGVACESPLAAEGEIVTSTLDGELGVIAVVKGKVKIGLAFAPAEGTTVTEFNCGSSLFTVSGSVIREVTSNKMLHLEAKPFSAHNGKQKPEKFENQPVDVLQTTIGDGPSEQTGLALKSEQLNEEAIEVNAIV